MRTTTRTQFKMWQPLPALPPEARENPVRSADETERGGGRTSLENSTSVRPGLPSQEPERRSPDRPDFSIEPQRADQEIGAPMLRRFRVEMRGQRNVETLKNFNEHD